MAAGGRVEIDAPSGRTAAEFAPFSAEAARVLEADLRGAISGEVDFSHGGRALFATDASNYRQVPIGVVTPRTREDVIEAVRLCRKHNAPILPRGGGTSLAGQSCNVAVTIDFSRNLTDIIELDPEARRAKVEPGCILDSLRDRAEQHNLTFGPDPATHDHNTLGGMIGNDSCGVHSVTTGRTADNVERLTVLTYDGELLDLGPTPEQELHRIIAAGGRRGEIYARMVELRDRYGELIEARFPKIPRLVSGFENLDALLRGSDFNVARAVTGTEGSCVVVLDATLKLVPSPPCRALALLSFDDVFAAADAVPSILEQGPYGLEGFDDKLFDAIRDGNVGGGGLRFFKRGGGWLIVEAGGETRAEAETKARRIAERSGHGHRCTIVSDPKDQKQVWKAREASLGATAFVSGQPEHWPGWEDSAVPPDRLGDYLRDLEKLFARHGYNAAVYGHFGDGVIHCRIDFDFHSEEGIANYRSFMVDAAHLVTSYGGSLSGEHGDGQSRAELLGIMYGPNLLRCFREFKAIWDPLNRMNPGKAIEPFPIDSNLRLGPAYEPPKLDTWFHYPADHGSFAHATARCVGVGKCRRRQVGEEVMCPSYLVTNEEKHCTRGRAHLLHEMTRGAVIDQSWRSDAVEDALSLCLACKGCKSDCPVGVDVATWKAEFRSHHYDGRMRPRSAYSMGLIDKWAKLGEAVPWLANAVTRTRLAKKIGGIDPAMRLPPFARQSFRRWFRSRAAPETAGERVLLWPDTFTNHFRPEIAIATVRLLEKAGFSVDIPEQRLCCGRPLYDWGFLGRAKRLWDRTLASLAEDIEAGTPLIALEPACASAFKDELVNLFSDDPRAKRLSEQTIYIADFVQAHLDRFPKPRRGGHVLLQVHCHHHAVIGFDAEQALLDHLGLDVERPPQGCCGMAGAFGMASETHEVGRAIGERVLLPRVRELPEDRLILADGFSCREQIEQHGGREARHIAELLAERML